MILRSSLFPLMHTSYVICILCPTRSLDLTHYWCLGVDPDPEGDVLIEAPVGGDYGWGSVDQVVKLEDGVPTQGA